MHRPDFGEAFQPVPYPKPETFLVKGLEAIPSNLPSTEGKSGRWNWKKIGIIAGGSIALVLAATAFHVALPRNALVFDAGIAGSIAHIFIGEALRARHAGVSFGEHIRRPTYGSEPVSLRSMLIYPGFIPTGIGSMILAGKLLSGS